MKPVGRSHPVGTTDEVNTPEQIGQALQITSRQVLGSIPGCTMSPTSLSRKLGVSRVMVSRLVNAIQKNDAVEALVKVPGPETLRSMMRSAGRAGVDPEQVNAALDAVESFARLIHDRYGTRSALNAALGVKSAESREKIEQRGRYQVFKGISQLFGVECKLWLSGVVLTPARERDGTWGGQDVNLNGYAGAVGLRRLRSDMPIKLDYSWRHKHMYRGELPTTGGPIDLRAFYTHPPAPLSEFAVDGQSLLTFAPPINGKEDRYDLLFANTIKVKGYATPDQPSDLPGARNSIQPDGRTARGRSVIPDFPSQELVIDQVIHKDLFQGAEPELGLYRTMGKGPSKLNDPDRACDVIETNERVEELGYGDKKLAIHQDLERYPEMIGHLCERSGYAIEDFRTYRFRVQYPVYGFQYLMSFMI